MLKKNWTKITDSLKAQRSPWIEDCTHPEVVKTMHESYSKTINKTMLSRLGVGLYSLLAVASSSDKSLIATNSFTGYWRSQCDQQVLRENRIKRSEKSLDIRD